MRKLFVILGLSCVWISCSHHKAEKVERAFYYWKSDNGSFKEQESAALKSLKVKELKDLVRLHGLASKPNPKKNDLVALLDQARSS